MNENNVCPLCESTKSRDFVKEVVQDVEYLVVKCKKCGLVYTLSSQCKDNNKTGKSKVSLTSQRESQYTKELQGVLVYLKNFYRKDVILLDVGCSDGLFLDMARNFGYKTEGIEIDEAAAKKVKAKGHRIIVGDIVKIRLTEDHTDAIVMFHTLEHLKNLLFVVNKIRSALKKDGITVVEVPNLWHWLLQRKFFTKRSLAPERHLYHFTPQTLRLLLENAGFKILKMGPANRYDKKGLLNKVLHFIVRIFSIYLFSFSGLVLSNSLRVYARKT